MKTDYTQFKCRFGSLRQLFILVSTLCLVMGKTSIPSQTEDMIPLGFDPIDSIDPAILRSFHSKIGKKQQRLNSSRLTGAEDFDLSTFVKDSLTITKDALCIDEVNIVLKRKYQRILDQYPENRAQIYKMIKDTSNKQCHTANQFLKSA